MTADFSRSPAPDTTDLLASLATGRTTARAAVEDAIRRIEAVRGLNALVADQFAAARAEADAIDAARARGEPLGPLAGVPVVIKETLPVAGLPCTSGVVRLKDARAEKTDRHVARLVDAGAIVLGVTNVAQGLFFIESDNPLYGRTNHPLSPDRSPGGSSGGQAALIAAGCVPLGLGSDIGGSVRQPAASCGIVGLKPTAGRLPDDGNLSMPRGQSLIQSQVGVHARSVRDVVLALGVLDRVGPIPATRGQRIGVYVDDGVFAPSAAVVRGVRLAADALRRAGAEVIEWRIPELEYGFSLFGRAFASDGGRWAKELVGGGPMDRRLAAFVQGASAPRWAHPLILALFRASGRRKLATLVSNYGHTDAASYWRTAEELFAWRERCLAAMDEARLDAVLSPGFALPTIRHGASQELIVAGTYTSTWNALGWPAGVVPTTRVLEGEERGTPRGDDVMERTAAATEEGSAGLPVAAQISARPGEDERVLGLLATIEADARVRGENVP